MSFIKEHEDGCVISVVVVPNAKKNMIVGVDENQGRIRIKVKSPPSEGRANAELIKFLSKLLNTKIDILSGSKSRKKELLAYEKSKEDVIASLFPNSIQKHAFLNSGENGKHDQQNSYNSKGDIY